MNEIVSEVMRLHGIKRYALLPIEGGALIMYFAPYSPYDYSEFPDCLKIDSYYASTSRASWTDKKVGKKGTVRYYKVRGFRKVAGKTYYTNWSVKKKLTV